MDREWDPPYVAIVAASMVALAAAPRRRPGWGNAGLEALRARTLESAGSQGPARARGDHRQRVAGRHRSEPRRARHRDAARHGDREGARRRPAHGGAATGRAAAAV